MDLPYSGVPNNIQNDILLQNFLNILDMKIFLFCRWTEMFYGATSVNSEGEKTEEETTTTPVEFPEVKKKVLTQLINYY